MEETISTQPRAVPLAKPAGNFVPVPGAPPKAPVVPRPVPAEAIPLAQPRMARPEQPPVRPVSPPPTMEEPMNFQPGQEEPEQADNEAYEEVQIGQQKIKLAIPAQVIKQAQSSNNENKNKLAGYWSAQILKGHPNLMHSSMADPVALWFEVKSVILKKFNSP